MDSRYVIVPQEELDLATLTSLIEEFVTRDGTEFTDSEEKIAEVKNLLKEKQVHIVFDLQEESCAIVESGALPNSDVSQLPLQS